jgi:N-acetylglucosaminyldiphosphoundecaprenol N-acetyl-beta-D-mannosaminyltransferase
MEILGIQIDNLSKNEVLKKVESFLSEDRFHQIVTVNPEFILEAQSDWEFKNILNNADLNIADGIGIRYAFLFFGKWLKYRIAGANMLHEILKIANDKKLSAFLAVNKNGLSLYEETKKAFFKLYPDIDFDGADIDPSDINYRSEAINYRLLFCNFGAPHQEKFINSVKNDTIRLAMGVGGSFDYVTGRIKRAPKIMRILGLEWFWRLILQPKRWKRIWNAVIVFPVKVIFSK